jgi:phage-related protein
VPLLPDLVGRIRLDMSELSRAQDEATSRGAMIGSALGTAVGSLAGGLLAAAGQQLLTFVSGSIDAFARLQDATSVTGIRFGEAQGSVDRFASGAAVSLGMSKASALEAANTFSVFGNQVGLTGEPLAQFSLGMTQLAGDMASFVGTSPEQAIDAIGSAFRGEYDPIEQYGVILSAAAVQQEAVRLGLVKQGEEMSNSAKVMATQSLITQQTSAAQGDFARTGESVANTQHRIAAETENAQAALGEKLAPAFLAVMNVLNQVIGGLTSFIDGIIGVVHWVQEWSDAIGAVLIVLGILNAQTIAANIAMAAYLGWLAAVRLATTVWTGVQWLLNAALTANPIGLVIAAIGALVAIFVVVYNHSEGFRNAIAGLWQGIKDFATGVVRSFQSFVTTVADAFRTAIGWVSDFFNWVASLPGKIFSNLSSMPSIIHHAIVDSWMAAVNGAIDVTKYLLNWLGGLGRMMLDAMGNLGNLLFDVGRSIIDGLLRGLQSLGGTIVSYLTELIPGPIRDALGISSPSKVLDDIGVDTMRGLDRGLERMLPTIRARVGQISATISQGGQFQVSMPTASGQTAGISGSISKAGNAYHIDARSFGSQLTPREVADAIVWNAKVGGLVPA